MLVVFLGMIVLVIIVFKGYGSVFESNVSLDKEYEIIYIASGSDFDDVVEELAAKEIIDSETSFRRVARLKEYDQRVVPGRFKIDNGMSNNALIGRIRLNENQDPVMVVFNNIRTLDQLAGKVSPYLEEDSAAFSSFLNSAGLPAENGFEDETFTAMFLPNTYEFFWNTSPEGFVERMKSEYEKFWNGERDRKAKKLGMTREEVVTLASIVDEETTYDDENSRVAGLYVNRLEKGIPLQADPTLKFALGDFTLKRILKEDTKIDSPYNTYKYKGLPPGPISIPSISAIEGVLNYEKHSFLYMCSKDDFSGYHAFARTLSQHNRNASKYHKALNRNRIYR